jgi:AIPR protein
MSLTYRKALEGRSDLKIYKDNALLLFTLQLRFDIEDIHVTAISSLTDGPDDKKCDLIYIDKEGGVAVIAQGYFCGKSTPPLTAPSNKASDLNTAVAWLFSMPIDKIPTNLKSAASELRETLKNNDIKSIEFWYSHNLPESENCQNELNAVCRNAKNAISREFPNCQNINISGKELGIIATENLYKNLTTPILVSDELSLVVPNGFMVSDSDWQSFITTIPASWLYEIFQKYESSLFSANIRGYLGSRNADANINSGIKKTAEKDSEHFYVFNNGITAITNSLKYDEENKLLILQGISIVNGAQTTGAIGSLNSTPSSNVNVQARFIVCSSTETIQSIIRYNNSQNKVEAPDFRSNDSIQTRLVNEFEDIPEAEYLGGRRGGSDDTIRWRTNLLPSSTIGQVLTAFHGDPKNAYDRKSNIWKSDTLYARVFNAGTTAKHIVFVYSLYKALDQSKKNLIVKNLQLNITEAEKKQLDFFQSRASVMLATNAIASCLEVVIGQQIPDLFRLSFGNISPNNAIEIWQELLEPMVSLISHLSPAIDNGIREKDITYSAIMIFRSLIDATKGVNHSIYNEFKSKIASD